MVTRRGSIDGCRRDALAACTPQRMLVFGAEDADSFSKARGCSITHISV